MPLPSTARTRSPLIALRRGAKHRGDSMALCLRAILVGLIGCQFACGTEATFAQAQPDFEFFEKKIRPVLVTHCYSCHSAESKELQGGLRLDVKAGWQLGGESGQPAIVPSKPEESPLIRSIRHDSGFSEMPPRQGRLSEAVIADLTAWVKAGAPDPRVGEVAKRDKSVEWETEFQQRMNWWSLKPVAKIAVPSTSSTDWARTEVDRFILAKLGEQGLRPNQVAERRTLARRLAITLTGLPPDPEWLETFCHDESSNAYDQLVTRLLESPHFGERWARHWMDVVHYADTHGYEWDVPAKNAWRYRDYLIRAFNSDLPYNQFVLEQIAGDLLPPRVNPRDGVNEALIGPMMLRLGERRHGDNSAAEGITQEAVANMIDTLGKAFLGTTLACAQCHDHKLDAVEQRDYYSLAGMLMSTRFTSRTIDVVDPNQSTVEQLSSIKQELRQELGRLWIKLTDLDQPEGTLARIRAIAADIQPAKSFPTSLMEFWKRSLGTSVTPEEFATQREQRVAANRQHLKLLADFTQPEGAAGWRWDGSGMKSGLVRDGELVVSNSENVALQQLLPAGRYSHVFSQRLAGSLQSPQLDPTQPITFSIEMTAGNHASLSFIVDRALNPERLQFPALPHPTWRTLTAGNFDSLEGTVDRAPRMVYFELATKALNNYFPPRVGYGGVKEADLADERSWFGVTRVYHHPPGQPPQDELERFAPLFGQLAQEPDWARRLTQLLRASVQRWLDGRCNSEDVRLLNDALQAKLLPQELTASPAVERLVKTYRELERKLQVDQTVGSADDWHEGRDSRVGIRGSYTDLGAAVPRGQVRFVSTLVPPSAPPEDRASQRLAWARQVAAAENPLTARVYVNRVWHYLFGEGLVRSPDDFGHLGERPSHPELLDYLAQRFMDEGWSTKKLIRLLVNSAVWQQSSIPQSSALAVDPENRLWHHRPACRLDAESLRDSILAVSGRLDPTLYGPAIEPFRTAEDSQKRLFKGPLDGQGRRSLYLEMTMMEPPRFLALFNQPLPKQTVGRRDVTNVPDQALALLNDPFVIDQARCWSERLITDGSTTTSQRIERMLSNALWRPARESEVQRLDQLVHRSAELRGLSGDLLKQPLVWQDAAHAVFNLKEFLYVP
jgi:hypothetical protein